MLHCKRIIWNSLLFSGLLFATVASLPAAEAVEPLAAETRAGQPLLSAEGSGSVSVDPDAFRMNIGVEARNQNLEKARSEVNTKMERIRQALKALRIAGLTLQTEILQISPVYAEDTTPPKITGYSVTNAVSVTVVGGTPAELGEHASRTIDTGISSGANNIGYISFFLQNSTEARDRALKAALDDATHKAQVIASAAGVKIIKLQAVEEASRGYMVAELPMMAAAMAAGPTPIETGKVVVTGSITARFVFAK